MYFSSTGKTWARFSYAFTTEKTAKAIASLCEGLDSNLK